MAHQRRRAEAPSVSLTACVLLSLFSAVAPSPDAPPAMDAWSADHAIEANARQAAAAEQAAAAIAPAERLEDYKHMPYCNPGDIIDSGADGTCLPFSGNLGWSATPPDCGGDTPVEPLWRSTRATTGSPWSEWRNVVGWTCPADYAPTFTAEDFRRLPLTPPPLTIQPARAEHLVNMPTIVYTTPTPQLLTTDLLGYLVEVEATPTTYTWDFDDTTVLTTTTPGHPYPDHDVAHPYAHPGTYTITLTTTWTGRYRLAGTTTWATVTGTATTTTTSPPITAVEAPTHLVTADCHQRPDNC